RPGTPAAPDTPRTRAGIAGSCTRCRRHKIRCDRNVPCSSCARLKKSVVCEYKPSQRNAPAAPLAPPPAVPAHGDDPTVAPQLLQDIPQASLLHPENMLLLSRHLFMNRSPDLPSPWPHWSAYASDHVPEPSMMRSAFNDLHTLAVSLTKRLMQTAMMQATSRLRAQRRRTNKGVMPFVKTRDVLSAIDVLGLERNGRARWIGVARRCNLRVFDEQRTTRFRIKRREISWDQAEKILSLYDVATMQSPADIHDAADPSDPDDDVFQRRAARHGTPLPMDRLSLSSSDSNSEVEDDAADSDESFRRDELATPTKQDSLDQSTSVESGGRDQDRPRAKQTLEQFDQEASRHEQESLAKLLGLTTAVKTPSPDYGPAGSTTDDDDDDDDDERLYTRADDWRRWTHYHAAWEEYQTPVPTARFVANQKPLGAPPLSRVQVDSDASSTASQNPKQLTQTRAGADELVPQNPRNYAAMKGSAFATHDDAPTSDVSTSDHDMDADVPAQSIEDTARTHSINTMDWDA
ncbi:hypothetical protein SVAN01_07432, partial [Stagonosporopsis vannaccii]